MIFWAIVFFILSVVAGVLGFGGLAEGFEDIAQFLFYTFIVLFVLTVGAALWAGNKAKDYIERRT